MGATFLRSPPLSAEPICPHAHLRRAAAPLVLS